jgi:hypothetical protein
VAAQAPDVPAARFAGTWVGTQAWAISEAPPGARDDQPVALTLELIDGRLTGTIRPFLGGDDGATIVEAAIVGEELRATAVVGRPRPTAGRRGGGPGNWKDATVVHFTFRGDAVTLTGTADVRLGDVPWMTFEYRLGRQRSRY